MRSRRKTEWRQRNVDLGLCYHCAKPRDGPSASLCNHCREVRRLQMRKRRGTQPWAKGKRGRPPLEALSKN